MLFYDRIFHSKHLLQTSLLDLVNHYLDGFMFINIINLNIN